MAKFERLYGIFFAVWAALFQVFFVACFTVWKDVVLIPSTWMCPPVTKEYWFWYIDERVPAVAYEAQLICVSHVILAACVIGFLLGIFVLLQEARHGSLLPAVILTVAVAVLCVLSVVYYRTYGQPYRLYMYMTIPELMAILVLGLTVLLRCRKQT